MRTPLLFALAVLVAGCSTITPVAVHQGDVCFRCRRTIEDTKLAAEVIDGGLHAFKFRTPGCLAQYLADHNEEVRAIFVTDYTTGKLVPAATASFVNVEIDQNTGERDYVAFATPAGAESLAATHRTSPISWQQVVGRARQVGD